MTPYVQNPEIQPEPIQETVVEPVLPSGYQPLKDEAPIVKKPRLVPIILSASLISGLIGGVTGFALSDRVLPGTNATNYSLVQADVDTSIRPDGSIADVASKVTPAVVFIAVQGNSEAASGSGFIVDSNGYIVTNSHVIASAANGGTIEVTLTTGETYKANLVGRNIDYDLAVIKINVSNLPTLQIGNSDGIVVGDSVIAIGAPLGLQGTVTSGIVSALRRPVSVGDTEQSFIDAIQTDAAINPGNSGGPLVNALGQVVGVNSAIATTGFTSGEAGSIGVGFAIPINQAKRIAEEIIATGQSTIPILGVMLYMSPSTEGPRIESVEANGPGRQAGLKKNDVVVKFNDRIIRDGTELVVAIRAQRPGDRVEVTLKSGKVLSVTLGSRVVK
ncbi:MAG: S1C family serine protease [Candidatus Nanopelagicales bacterium]